jgi:molybdenum cofactor cytidylyltransferase
MNLLKCLDLKIPARTAIVRAGLLQIAVVGAGGKTTACFSLARQVEGLAWVTTTTHLGTDQVGYADRHFVLEFSADFKPELYKQQKVTLLTGPFTADSRVHAPSPELLELIHETSLHENIPLFIEADGSRSIPLKAPGEHEPPIPDWVTHVVVLVGISALGKNLSSQTVFRAERFSELTGLPMGKVIDMKSICAMLTHPLGGLKDIPAGAQKVALFNQADNVELKEMVKSAAPGLLEGGYDKVIAGGLQSAPDELVCFTQLKD